MGDDAWATVLRWHDRTIRELLVRHHGTEVKQRGGGDGFFAVFGDPKAGIDCASAIHATFARHRAEHGFTPAIRIGVHEAPALQHAGDYSGRGVHEAARIAELAGAGEIMATAATARPAGASTREASHAQQLRGLPGHYEVVYVNWDSNAGMPPRYESDLR
jgi:class 3 adenylate cyclase